MTVDFQNIVLGTRGSELALVQVGLVEKAIQAAWPDLKIETKIITTSGDKPTTVDRRAGWKGWFTAEIERALLAGDVDLAVHSAKDLPSATNSGARVAAVLPRAAVDDVLITKHSGGLGGLPDRATVATSSVRRKHQLRWKRPDISVIDLRGNVPTRLRKLKENDWDAIVLARAGFERLGIPVGDFLVETLPQQFFLPAGGQGIIAIQSPSDDERLKTIVDVVNDQDTLLCLRTEREFLRLLNVDCNAPVGVLAQIENGKMTVQAQIFENESSAPREGEVEGRCDDGERLAGQLLNRLRLRA